MAARRFSLEFLVGLFVLIGLGIMLSFVFLISGFQFVRPGFQFKVTFNYSNGVKTNAPVRVSGVELGDVKDVKLIGIEDNKPLVAVLVWVPAGTKIPRDSKVHVNTLGLLGEKYLEIIPGDDYASLLSQGSTIKGEEPLSMFEVTGITQNIAMKLEETVANIQRVTDALAKGEGTIGRLLIDDSVYTNLDEFVADLKSHPWKLFWRTKEKKLAR